MSDEDGKSEPRTVVYNGVGIPTDTPEKERDYWPEFEDGTSGALRRRVRRGDDVVVVGGGRGITTVVAARMTHFEGTVTTYEANSERLATLRRTVEVNRVADLVTLEHAAVGPVSDRSVEIFSPKLARRNRMELVSLVTDKGFNRAGTFTLKTTMETK